MSREPCVRGISILLKLFEAKEQRRKMGIWFVFLRDGKWVLREPRESTTLAWREREDVGFSLFLFGFSPQGYLNGSFSILTKVTENRYTISLVVTD